MVDEEGFEPPTFTLWVPDLQPGAFSRFALLIQKLVPHSGFEPLLSSF